VLLQKFITPTYYTATLHNDLYILRRAYFEHRETCRNRADQKSENTINPAENTTMYNDTQFRKY